MPHGKQFEAGAFLVFNQVLLVELVKYKWFEWFEYILTSFIPQGVRAHSQSNILLFIERPWGSNHKLSGSFIFHTFAVSNSCKSKS